MTLMLVVALVTVIIHQAESVWATLAWVVHTLVGAPIKCDYPDCGEAGEYEPLDGGPGARCVAHIDL